KGACAAIASIQGRARHFFSGRKQLQGVKQAELLAPFAESHFGFRKEDALDRSFAGAAVFAERLQCFRFTGIGEQGLDNSHGSRVRRTWKLQRDGINGLQLVDEDFENSLFNWGFLVQPLKRAGMENQLSQKRSDIHDETFLGKPFHEPWKKIE